MDEPLNRYHSAMYLYLDRFRLWAKSPMSRFGPQIPAGPAKSPALSTGIACSSARAAL
ncbi:MAG: hypothetical protein JWN85_3883 [Gammaproteobacteria bacterium]|nr:hypothetical protein [Gammaproteobacteria bacterium]